MRVGNSVEYRSVGAPGSVLGALHLICLTSGFDLVFFLWGTVRFARSFVIRHTLSWYGVGLGYSHAMYLRVYARSCGLHESGLLVFTFVLRFSVGVVMCWVFLSSMAGFSPRRARLGSLRYSSGGPAVFFGLPRCLETFA